MRCFELTLCQNDGKVRAISKEGIPWCTDHAGQYYIDTPKRRWQIFLSTRPDHSWFPHARLLVDPTKSLEATEDDAVCLQIQNEKESDNSQILVLVRVSDEIPVPDWTSFVDDSFQYLRDSVNYVCGDKESERLHLLVVRDNMNYTMDLGDIRFTWDVTDSQLRIEETAPRKVG